MSGLEMTMAGINAAGMILQNGADSGCFTWSSDKLTATVSTNWAWEFCPPLMPKRRILESVSPR